jgi:hypothetical protein
VTPTIGCQVPWAGSKKSWVKHDISKTLRVYKTLSSIRKTQTDFLLA